MIRSQKVPVRAVYNPTSNETNQPLTSAGDITSYIGKILTINHHQVIVEDILGQGGFAFVFLVRSYNHQKYALKRMYVNNQRDLHVCQREISLVKELSANSNIVKYVDSFVHRLSPTNILRRQQYTGGHGDQNDDDDDDDAIYEILLLTEYCSNGALINRLNEQRNVGLTLNERQIIRIFADICNAVSACHFRRPQPILHRDIKLENILIDSHQSYVLCDFGSAILLPSSTTNDHQQYSTSELTTGVIQQLEEEIQRYTTLSYRAPEMIDLYSRIPITLKADIWAMGCLLYKLMYNTMPFGESILAIQNGTFVIPDDMAQVYSRELNMLIRYLLEIDIKKRPDIWQVSYLTYKLLGSDCPVPNRCQSKIPDAKSIPMPLTESEFRYQRTNASSKSKSPSANVSDESLPLGTAVNPRERPRGIASSTSLINFGQPSSVLIVRPPPPPPPTSSSLNPSRSGSAAQLMFDDDFSKIPTHAISLTNIPTGTSSNTNEHVASRARPSPPATISAASGFVLQQQLLFPLPPPSAASSSSFSSSSASNVHAHRRSSSQTINSTNIQSSFQNASSVDIPLHDEASDDDDDANTDQFNRHSQLYSDDDQSFSPENQKIETNSTDHHPSTEEAEKNLSLAHRNPKNSIQPDKSKAALFNLSKQPFTKENSIDNSFDRLLDEDSDTELDRTIKAFHHSTISNKDHNQTESSITDITNPFLHAPFPHSTANKQIVAPTSINSDRIINAVNTSSFDANSIVIGKKTSAFTPYQKQDIKSDNLVIDTANNVSTSTATFPQSGSFPSDKLSPPPNVFTNAPFKTKPNNKQRSTTTNTVNTTVTSSNKTHDSNKTTILADNEPQQHGYSNLSFHDTIIEDYF